MTFIHKKKSHSVKCKTDKTSQYNSQERKLLDNLYKILTLLPNNVYIYIIYPLSFFELLLRTIGTRISITV